MSSAIYSVAHYYIAPSGDGKVIVKWTSYMARLSINLSNFILVIKKTHTKTNFTQVSQQICVVTL